MTQVVVYGTSERLPWSSVPDPSRDREILARRSAGGREPGCVNSAQTYGYGDDSAGRPADSSSVGLSLSVAIGDMSFRSYAYVIVRFDERAHARSLRQRLGTGPHWMRHQECRTPM